MADPGWSAPGQGSSPIPPSPPRSSFTTTPVTGGRGDPPRGGRRRPWALIVLLAGLVLVGVVVLVAMAAGSGGERSFQDGSRLPGPADPQGLDLPLAPPSERGALPTTSLPAVVDEPDRSTRAAAGGEDFAELTCRFTGTSDLANPLLMDDRFPAAPNRMTLEPGAAFDCTDGDQASAGTIDLEATFGSLSALSGVGAGQGRIRWSELPEARRDPGVPAESTTGVEVQVEVPVIVVWTSILDGPYAGYRGRLVLRDWEPIFADGDITGVRFATTSTTFAPT